MPSWTASFGQSPGHLPSTDANSCEMSSLSSRRPAAEVVEAVYRIQHLRQTVPYATAEEVQLQTWLNDGQENAAAWPLDEDLLRQSEPPLWCPGPPPPTGALNDPGLD